MTNDSEWVLLVECNTMAELHTLRATLEARGVPCRLHGEHTHGVLGPIQGAAVRSRVLVPRRALAVARSLAEDIVGPFDEPPAADEDEAGASPFRTAAELGPDDYDDEEDEHDAAQPHDPTALAEPDDPDEPRDPMALRPRTYAALPLIVLTGVGPLLGFSHLYLGHSLRAAMLVLVSIVAFVANLGGAEWGVVLLGLVWLVDLVGGTLGIAAHNRRLAALALAPAPPQP
jgi:hypothetical protein